MKKTIIVPVYYKITQEEFDNSKSFTSVYIQCQTCLKDFTSSKKNILKGFSRTLKPVMYCSSKCSSAYKLKEFNSGIKCTNCSIVFIKANSQIEKTENHFCSRSCAATYNNKIYIKRSLTRICVKCDKLVLSYRHIHCEQHHIEYKQDKYQNRTIGEYRNKLSVKGKHTSWLNSHIRLFAKSWNKELTLLPCARCNYEKHVELAHIKGITEYSDESLLSVVNHKDNIIQLCPNCHWEFDNEPRESFKQLLIDLNKSYSNQ